MSELSLAAYFNWLSLRFANCIWTSYGILIMRWFMISWSDRPGAICCS